MVSEIMSVGDRHQGTEDPKRKAKIKGDFKEIFDEACDRIREAQDG